MREFPTLQEADRFVAVVGCSCQQPVFVVAKAHAVAGKINHQLSKCTPIDQGADRLLYRTSLHQSMASCCPARANVQRHNRALSILPGCAELRWMEGLQNT